jgi:hypothetical protein
MYRAKGENMEAIFYTVLAACYVGLACHHFGWM